MKWGDVTDADLIGALNAVEYSHDPVAARNLIEYFHERFSNEMPYNDDVLLAFIRLAFKRIADDGWSADHAFGLKLKRGHYLRDDTTERDVMAAAFVILRMRQGWRWSDAVGGAEVSNNDSGDENEEKEEEDVCVGISFEFKFVEFKGNTFSISFS